MSPTTPTVVVLHDGTHPPAMDQAATLATLRYATETELPHALPDADVLFCWHFLSEALTDAWPTANALRWAHAASAGVDALLFPGLRDSAVTVTNSRGVFDRPMAEYVLGTVLCLAKDMHTSIRLQDQRTWHHRDTERISGKRALVVGSGPIGRAIATQLAAAGLHITGIGRTARTSDPDFGEVHAFDSLDDHLGHADYIVLAAPLTDQTRGMINSTTLARLAPTARLINVGRGDLVVQDDLVDALAHHRLAGAALDVFETEPLPADSPLWTMPHVLISPHMSGDTTGWHTDLVELFTSNLDRYVRGEPLRNIVDKQRGYVSG